MFKLLFTFIAFSEHILHGEAASEVRERLPTTMGLRASAW